ncbi:MAG: phosphatase PAP2 family protein [Patescibacteria group bacterium]
MSQIPKPNLQRTGWLICLGGIAIFLALYGFVSHLPIDRHAISFILNEEKVPFLPWTLIVYLSVFLQAGIILRLTPHKLLPRTLFFGLCIAIIGFIIFIIFPIEYPRNLYPTANKGITFLRKIYSSGNCFPSLHVAMTLLLTGFYCLVQKSKKLRFLMCLWAIAIVFSVLTTKQHYLIDIFGGVILATPFIFALKRGRDRATLR